MTGITRTLSLVAVCGFSLRVRTHLASFGHRDAEAA